MSDVTQAQIAALEEYYDRKLAEMEAAHRKERDAMLDILADLKEEVASLREVKRQDSGAVPVPGEAQKAFKEEWWKHAATPHVKEAEIKRQNLVFEMFKARAEAEHKAAADPVASYAEEQLRKMDSPWDLLKKGGW